MYYGGCSGPLSFCGVFMRLLSNFENHNRQSLIYEMDKEFLVVYKQDERVHDEKVFLREWEAEFSAENFVCGDVY